MPTGSPLDRTIAQTWRRARWPKTQGQAVCPRCHDGGDLRPDRAFARRRQPAAEQTYYCRACLYRFTDRTHTPLQGSPLPLRAWALAALVGPLTALSRALGARTGLDYRTLARLSRRLQISEIGERWRCELLAVGLTIGRLRLPGRRRA